MGNLIYKIANAVGFMHPIHPLLVHITIGTIVASLVFGIVGFAKKKPVFFKVARYNANLTLISVFLTIPMGIIDWTYYFNGALSTTITMKLILSGTILALLIVTFIVNRKNKEGSLLLLILYIVNFINAVFLGFFGGNLVY